MNRDLFLACVADATRFALLEQLAESDACVNDLVAATGQSQSNVSHHLRQLRDCGFVDFVRDGKQNRYHLAHPEVASFVRIATTTAAAVRATCEVCA